MSGGGPTAAVEDRRRNAAGRTFGVRCDKREGDPDTVESIALCFMLSFAAVGALMVGLSIPLVRRRVKPNPWYGFRTPKSMSNERIWYEANAYAGRLAVRLGLGFIVAVVGLYFILRPKFGVYNLACTAVLLGAIAVQLVLCFRYLRSL